MHHPMVTEEDCPTVQMRLPGGILRNGLLLNPSKTEALLTGTRQQVAKLDATTGMQVADVLVPYSSAVRVLGVTIDQHMAFDKHVTDVVKCHMLVNSNSENPHCT